MDAQVAPTEVIGHDVNDVGFRGLCGCGDAGDGGAEKRQNDGSKGKQGMPDWRCYGHVVGFSSWKWMKRQGAPARRPGNTPSERLRNPPRWQRVK